MNYTSVQAITHRLRAAAQFKAKSTETEVDEPTLERWIEQNIERVREAGKLMTDQQLADHRAGRTFDVGDEARYVGPDRVERVGNNERERPRGQPGKIVEVTQQHDAEVVTFRPLADVLLRDEELVELVVKTGTAGYLDLERQP